MPLRSLFAPLAAALLAVALSVTAAGCTSEAPGPAASDAGAFDGVLLDAPDAVLDSMLARWDAATEGVTGYTLTTNAVVARYARRPDGAFALAGAEARTSGAASAPLQFLQPDLPRVAALLRGQADLYLDRSVSPPRYRLVADSARLGASADSTALAAPPAAADVLIEAGTYRLREVHTRAPLPGAAVDSALVDLRIAYSDYGASDDLPVPRRVRVVATGLLDTFDPGELMFMRAQYQQRLGRVQGLAPEARAAEEAELAELKALLLDGVSVEEMVVDSVAVERAGG